MLSLLKENISQQPSMVYSMCAIKHCCLAASLAYLPTYLRNRPNIPPCPSPPAPPHASTASCLSLPGIHVLSVRLMATCTSCLSLLASQQTQSVLLQGNTHILAPFSSLALALHCFSLPAGCAARNAATRHSFPDYS